MKKLILASSLLLGIQSQGVAKECKKPVCVKKVSTEGTKILKKRNFFFPKKGASDWEFGFAVGWELESYNNLIYHSNKAYFDTETHKASHIGWQFEMGINISEHIKIFWQHHSEHAAEEARDNEDYPLDDRVGFRITAYGN